MAGRLSVSEAAITLAGMIDSLGRSHEFLADDVDCTKWCASSRYFVGTGTFNDKLFGGDWHVGHGVMCQGKGLGLNG